MSTMPAFGLRFSPPLANVPAGFPHLDDFIDGQRPGECYGLIDPNKEAATIQLSDLSVQNARTFHRIGMTTGTPGRVSVLFSYEQSTPVIKPRIWANATLIRHEKLDPLDWSRLTTQDNLETYEHQLTGYYPSHQVVPSESERWDLANPWLNSSLIIRDMTGEQDPDAGKGYIEELVARLERIRSKMKAEIGAVQIDSAARLCERYVFNQEDSSRSVRSCLMSISNSLRREIAVKFNCPVWVSSGGLRPKEIDSFSQTLVAYARFEAMHRATDSFRLHWPKPRNHNPNCRAAPVVRIDRDFYRMIEVNPRSVSAPR